MFQKFGALSKEDQRPSSILGFERFSKVTLYFKGEKLMKDPYVA